MSNFLEKAKYQPFKNTIMESKKDYVNRLLNEARLQGLCKNKGEFAELLGMNPSTISHALKGEEKYLTDSILRRFRSWERQVLRKGEDQPAQPVPEDNRPDIVIPAATMDLYTSMAKSIDRLTALVERLQPGASSFTFTQPAPKNFRIEK